MITELTIDSKEIITTSESSKTQLTELVSEYAIKPNYYDIDLTMSYSTYNECNSELHSMFGDLLDDITIIIPDHRFSFGVIDLMIRDKRTNEVSENNRYNLFAKEKTYDLDKFKTDIAIQTPGFIITDMSTWGLISDLDFENTDKYGNQIDYYHSYCMVPVAISEFVHSGQVLLVK